MTYAIVAFVAACFGAAFAHVATVRGHARRLLAPPIETDPELRLVDIGEEKRSLYRQIDDLDTEEGFIIETWRMGERPVPGYLEYAIERSPTE